MPGGGSHHRRGGRQKGTPNKRTQEALLKQAMEVHQSAKTGKKLAKDVLDDLMQLTVGMAGVYQPDPPDRPGLNPYASEEKFWKCVEMARDFATALAKYQSPTFRAIAVHVSPENQDERRPGPDGARQVEGKVIDLNDAEALARVYKRRIAVVK